MVFKLWRLLPISFSDPGDSLSKPNLLSQLGEGAIIFNLLPNIVQHVHFPFFHCFKDQIFGLHSYGQWHFLGELGIFPGYQGHSSHMRRSPSHAGCIQHTQLLWSCVPVPDSGSHINC